MMWFRDSSEMLEMTLLQSVHSTTRKTLLKVKGFSEVKVEKIKEAIQKCQVGFLHTPSPRICKLATEQISPTELTNRPGPALDIWIRHRC